MTLRNCQWSIHKGLYGLNQAERRDRKNGLGMSWVMGFPTYIHICNLYNPAMATSPQPHVLRWGIISTGNISTAFVKVS